MTVATAAPHTSAVVAALQAASVSVGRGVKPDAAGWQGEPGRSAFVPYAVLYPSPGMPQAVNLADPQGDLDYTVQVTCVGAIQDQAETLMDTIKTTLVGRVLTVTGRQCRAVYQILDRPATRDDQVSPAVHYAVAQFRFHSSPA